MRRVRIEKPGYRLDRWWLEVLPIDPRDADVLRAKSLACGGSLDSPSTGDTRKGGEETP